MSVLNEYMNSTHITQKDILQHTGIHRRTLDDVLDRIELRMRKKKELVMPTVIPKPPVVSQEILEKKSSIEELAQQVKEDEGGGIMFDDLLSGLTVGEDDDDLMSNDAVHEDISSEGMDISEIQRLIDGHIAPSQKLPVVADNKNITTPLQVTDDFADIQRMIDEQSASSTGKQNGGDFGDLLKGLK